MDIGIIYWVLLVLCFIGYLPAAEPYTRYFGAVNLILFAILGVKIFGGLR